MDSFGPIQPEQLQAHYRAQCKLVIWVITFGEPNRPSDFQVRPWIEGRALNQAAVAGTLPVARSYIPSGLLKSLVSMTPDDPYFVEGWM